MLKSLNPEKVITLIDDIYEIYHRLTKKGGLYTLMQKVTKTEVIFRHIRLLDWRAKETMMSRFLAEQIKNCSHIVLATKHSFDTLTSLINGTFLTAYLSHPISEVRRLEALGEYDRALNIKKEIAEISEYLSIGFTTFLPTTIDEYRISSKESDSNGQKTLNYISALNVRWEKDKYKDPQHILYQPCDFPNDSQLWTQDISEFDLEDLSQLFSILASIISVQVTTRDYTLVEQSEVLIIYRPLFNGNLAGGVQKEYNYFKHIQAARQKEIICFIYCPQEDIDKFYINEFNARIRYYLSLPNNGLKLKNGVKNFIELSEEECGKLLNIELNKNLILEFFTEVMDKHGMFIDISTVIRPLNDTEIQIQEQFLENFVTGLLKNYEKLDEYKRISTYFEPKTLTPDQLYDNIVKTVTNIAHGK
ncbi:hypothetical protein GCM10028826_18060 [Mucilaginibacter boryungensis]